MRKKILIGSMAGGVIAAIILLSMYFKPHRNMVRSSAAYSMTSNELLAEFESDESVANEKLVDKVVEVSGPVADINTDDGKITIIIGTDNPLSGIICEMDDLSSHNISNFAEGQSVTLKCLCTGYLMDVSMRRCVAVK